MQISSYRKPYKLSFETKQGYLVARVSGDAASLETSRQYWSEIAAEVLSQHTQRLLVWEDFEGEISTQDTFTLVKELCEFKQFKELRLVVLDEHLDQFDRNKLGEMIANNHGLTCRVFSDFEEAEQWLLAA